MSVDHFVMLEIREVLRGKKKGKGGGVMSKKHRNQPERTPNGQSWDNLNDKINHNSIEL